MLFYIFIQYNRKIIVPVIKSGAFVKLTLIHGQSITHKPLRTGLHSLGFKWRDKSLLDHLLC